ncbi:VIT domain-containing protein [Calditrichota bacterium]
MKILIVFLIVLITNSLFAQGRIFIPEPPRGVSSSPVNLKSVKANIQLKEGVGDITLEETFFNPSNFRLEGEYIFALPGESQIHDFNLYINGKKTAGEVLDGSEATKIYEGIVRKMRDPALLEYAGNSLFKARIFPIEPKADRKIELSYAQAVFYDGKAYKFSLPIKQSGQGSIENFYMVIDLQTKSPLGNIYSPSHQIHITRNGDKRAKITLEATNMEAEKDLILYYSLDQKEINATLLTFRPRTDRDGYFMLLASPSYDIEDEKYIPKDIIFVIDVSGSMSGEKIQQAKEALRFCVNTLKPADNFEIISFSTSLNNFQNQLKNAGKDEIENAKYFIDNLNASGGTNINEALKKALRLKTKNDNRPTSIVFLTDGLPTEGETNINTILQNIKAEKKEFIRIFSFGVGFDVNTFLLDKISQDSHGSANYVKPGEDIEKEVSTFFAKISNPVMTSPNLDFTDAGVYDVYPQDLPDIFKGQRVSALGRYRHPGEVTIFLSGKQKDYQRKFEYDVEFERRETENDFIAKLWANRKVSHLLAQIRFNGENKELVESIKQLGKEYGIVTPYTSYLVTEQEKELAAIDARINRGAGGVVEIRMQRQQRAREIQAEENEESVGSKLFYDAVMAAPKAASNASGRGAVMSSRAMKKIAHAEKDEAMIITVKRISDRTFNLNNGVWVENNLKLDSTPDKIIKFLSDEYFELVKENNELKKILSLGEEVLFNCDREVYIIVNK